MTTRSASSPSLAVNSAQDHAKNCGMQRALGLLLLMLAATPVIHVIGGIASGNQATPFHLMIRSYWTPTLFIECITIIYAILKGVSFGGFFKALPSMAKAALGVWIAGIVISSLFPAQSLSMATHKSAIWMIHILFAASVWHLACCLNKDAFRRQANQFAIAVVSSAALTMTILIFYLVWAGSPSSFNLVSETPGFSNIRHWGQFLLPALAVMAGLSFTSATKKNNIYTSIFYIALLTIGLWSGHRGVVISLLAGTILMFVFFPIVRSTTSIFKQAACWTGATTASLLISFPANSAYHAVGRIFRPLKTQEGLNSYSSSRVEFWNEAIYLILNRPLGYGGDHYRWIAPMARETFNHPHNVILQMAFDWGLLGVSGFAMLAMTVALPLWRRRETMSELGIIACFVAMVIAIWSMIDGALYYPMGICFFICAVAFALRDVRGQLPNHR